MCKYICLNFSAKRYVRRGKNQSSNKTVIQIKDFPVETANELEKLEFHHFKNNSNFSAKNREFLPASNPCIHNNPKVSEQSQDPT